MTTKAIFLHTDRALTGTDEDRAALHDFVKQCSTRQFNIVAVSALPKAALEEGLTKTGIRGNIVYALDAETAVASNLDATPTPATFKHALGSLNQLRCIAKAAILSPGECLAITDVRKVSSAALKNGITGVCIEGNMRDGKHALDFALQLG